MTWVVRCRKERIMKTSEFIMLFGRNDTPVDKFDVAIAKIALFAVKFTVFLISAFALLLIIL